MHATEASPVVSHRTWWALLVGLSLCAAASGMTLREMRLLEKTGKEGINYANYYLVGAMEGVLEAHAHGVRSGARPRICLEGRVVRPSSARSLYDTELQRNDGVYEADMPVELVVANALSTVYSCGTTP